MGVGADQEDGRGALAAHPLAHASDGGQHLAVGPLGLDAEARGELLTCPGSQFDALLVPVGYLPLYLQGTGHGLDGLLPAQEVDVELGPCAAHAQGSGIGVGEDELAALLDLEGRLLGGLAGHAEAAPQLGLGTSAADEVWRRAGGQECGEGRAREGHAGNPHQVGAALEADLEGLKHRLLAVQLGQIEGDVLYAVLTTHGEALGVHDRSAGTVAQHDHRLLTGGVEVEHDPVEGGGIELTLDAQDLVLVTAQQHQCPGAIEAGQGLEAGLLGPRLPRAGERVLRVEVRRRAQLEDLAGSADLAGQDRRQGQILHAGLAARRGRSGAITSAGGGEAQQRQCCREVERPGDGGFAAHGWLHHRSLHGSQSGSSQGVSSSGPSLSVA